LVILEPELSRARDLASMSWLDWRFEAAMSAEIFVFMTIGSVCFVRLVRVFQRGFAARTFVRQFGNSAKAARESCRSVALLDFIIDFLPMDWDRNRGLNAQFHHVSIHAQDFYEDIIPDHDSLIEFAGQDKHEI
jgi:hypothetical protein